jgi:hypothetical protein
MLLMEKRATQPTTRGRGRRQESGTAGRTGRTAHVWLDRPIHAWARAVSSLSRDPEADTARSLLHSAWTILGTVRGCGLAGNVCWFRRHGCGRCPHARDRALGRRWALAGSPAMLCPTYTRHTTSSPELPSHSLCTSSSPDQSATVSLILFFFFLH